MSKSWKCVPDYLTRPDEIMPKFAKFNRTDLTPIQVQERKRRRMMMRRMRGMETPKHATQRWPSPGEPVFKPMPAPVFSGDAFQSAFLSFISFLPWFRRRKKEAELAEQQKMQSLKDQGVH